MAVNILIGIAGLVVLILAIALLVPNEYSVERNIVIEKQRQGCSIISNILKIKIITANGLETPRI